MESPFATTNTSFVLYLEPIRDAFNQTYRNIITVSSMPPGPLNNMVSPMSYDKLSPFQSNHSSGCIHVLRRYPNGIYSKKNADYFMEADDIPSVISYLRQNGYTIDTEITTMLYKSSVSLGSTNDANRLSRNRQMICMCSIT
jgi:hypothetical protein